MAHELRLYRDELAPGALMPVNRNKTSITATYIVTGSLRLRSEALNAGFSANSAFHVKDAAEVLGGSWPVLALRWELAAARSARSEQPAPGVVTKLLLNAPISLDSGKSYLLRCDRVDFPTGGVAFLHTHQGGGIRCLLAGSIEIETLAKRHRYGPLEAWFEAGPDPVFAAASATEPSTFVRLMILPRSLLGKSSISYVNADDLARPKSQSYQVFIDTPFELPQ